MGSSRSHAADMEDTIVTCKYGVDSRYFVDCRCDGCKADREHWRLAMAKAESIRYIALDFFSKLPQDQWDSVVSLRIK